MLLDYFTHPNDPTKFFVTDLAIITLEDGQEFTFTEKVIPICLPHDSLHGGPNVIQHTNQIITGKYQMEKIILVWHFSAEVFNIFQN